MNKLVKLFAPILKWLIVLFMVVFTANSVYNYFNAAAIGERIGRETGEMVGTALGSFRGVTAGVKEGYTEGAEDGLDSGDIAADVSNAMRTIGKLEVLIAETKFHDLHRDGDTYAAIYEAQGTGVFAVDLNDAQIVFDEQERIVSIIIPEPQFDYYLHETEMSKICETGKVSIHKGAKEGAVAYNNSVKKVKENIENYLVGYDMLVENANTAAKNQIKNLVSTIVGDTYVVYVYFR